MRCSFEEKISVYADGQLSPEELPEVEAHLDSCASCSALLDDIISLKTEMEPASALKAAPLRRNILRSFKSRKKLRMTKILSSAAAAVVLLVSLPFFLQHFSPSNSETDQFGSPEAAATNATYSLAPSSGENLSEIELYFSDPAHAGQSSTIYGYTCVYLDNQQQPAADSSLAESDTKAAGESTEDTASYDAGTAYKYTVAVSGFTSDAQKITLRKALISLSAPAASNILITDDGSIPLNIFSALQLISSYHLDIQILYAPGENSLESHTIKLQMN